MRRILQFELNDLSKYRTQLMGMAAIMIIACHAEASHVLMPNWLGHLLVLGNYGVEIFLILSGLGCYYSLSKADWGGHFTYWKRRGSRIIIPYLIVFVPYSIILLCYGQYTEGDCLLSVTALEYWLYHRGAWFISLIIPLYFVSPLIFKLLQRKAWLFATTTLIVICMLLCNIPTTEHSIIDNIQLAFSRSPCFILGMIIGKGCKENKSINILWVILLALLFAPLRTLFGWNKVGWLLSPFILLVVTIVVKWIFKSEIIVKCLKFFGKISLESYLINITLNSLLSLLITTYFTITTIFYGKYLQYSIVIVLGTFLAYGVHVVSQRLLEK